jgi:hypothetical protein
MEKRITSSGFASPIQVIDVTGHIVSEGAVVGTGASTSSSLFMLDVYGEQIPVETLQDKLAAIREKSHAELGEAWRRLAQM